MEKALNIISVLGKLLVFAIGAVKRGEPEKVEDILGAPMQLALEMAAAKAERDAKWPTQ